VRIVAFYTLCVQPVLDVVLTIFLIVAGKTQFLSFSQEELPVFRTVGVMARCAGSGRDRSVDIFGTPYGFVAF
jgi:hypothetical protein